MCGICGILDFPAQTSPEGLVRKMVRAIKHRGPDDDGVFVQGPVALGHTRLSILDLSAAGHQPMLSGDGRHAIAFNGEIYNYRELREELRASGIVFRTGTDTEVLLHALIRWGMDALPRLNGMFAFAFWDDSARTLWLARDRFGIKPLYYRPQGRGLAFGSEIKAILEAGSPAGVAPGALHEYLWYGNALGSQTLFEGILKLPPGHYLKADAGGMSLRRYWDILDISPAALGEQEAIREVGRTLEAAVRRHLVSDVPVGVFLSGGIDSSAITAFAARHCGGRLRTFSVGFDFDKGVDELPKARRLAERFGTDHREIRLAGADMREVIEDLVRCHDEPFGDAANIPLYLLCRSLKDEVKVVLQGDGGDEIFGGYRRYAMLSRETVLRTASRIGHAATALMPRGPLYHRGRRFLAALGHPDPALRMALLLTEESLESPPSALLSPELREQAGRCDPFAEYRICQSRFADRDPVQRMLLTDCSLLLPNTFLEKVDKSTMAHGMEIRVPFLDAELANLAIGLPSELKVRGGEKKWILRQALRGIVPDDVLDGPKTGFGVPYGHWLRDSLSGYMRSVLTDAATMRAGLFDQLVLEARMDEHISGRRNNGFILWKALNLALWHRRYVARAAG